MDQIVEVEKMRTGVRVMEQDMELILSLSELSGREPEAVANMLSHNVIPVKELSVITGKSVAAVEGLTRPTRVGGETKLTPVWPFGNSFKFVLRDEKFDQFIKQTIEKWEKSESETR